jgi:hypothetical protein
MNDPDRFQLLGTYTTPRFRYGQVVFCQVRGEVVITGLHEAPIPWPLCRKGRERPALLVYEGLAKAVRRESAIAICHHWGVTPQTVSKWRKALGVGPNNHGTLRLRREYSREPAAVLALQKACAKAKDPLRCAKIALAKRGKPQPRHVIEAMRKANLGRSPSAETRQKLSEAARRRGTRPPAPHRPWEAWEEALLGVLPDEEVAQRTGRTVKAVYGRRWELRIPAAGARG